MNLYGGPVLYSARGARSSKSTGTPHTNCTCFFRSRRVSHRCGLLLQTSHVPWSVCWAHQWVSLAKTDEQIEVPLVGQFGPTCGSKEPSAPPGEYDWTNRARWRCCFMQSLSLVLCQITLPTCFLWICQVMLLSHDHLTTGIRTQAQLTTKCSLEDIW